MSDYNRQRDLAEGLQIFMRYGGKNCDAQHDIIYASQESGMALSEKDRDRLLELGWHHDSDCDCDIDIESDDDGYELAHDLTCDAWAFLHVR